METETDDNQLLIQQIWELMESESWEAAIAICEELKAIPSEAGFRMRAMIHVYQEEPQAALAEIQAGIKQFPEAWELHMQWGNLLSDSGDPSEALTVFDKASKLPGVEMHWIQLNQAMALFRQQSFEEALDLLQGIDHPQALNDAFALQLAILDTIGRHDLILEIAEEDLELLNPPEDDADAEVLARICTSVASAAWYQDKGEEIVRFYLQQVFDYQRGNPQALWLWREMNPLFSDQAQFYTLLMRGRFVPSEDGVAGEEFLTSYGVMADSPEEAVEMIRALEGADMDSAAWEVLEVEIEELGEEEEIDAKGIYYVSGFGMFEEEA